MNLSKRSILYCLVLFLSYVVFFIIIKGCEEEVVDVSEAYSNLYSDTLHDGVDLSLDLLRFGDSDLNKLKSLRTLDLFYKTYPSTYDHRKKQKLDNLYNEIKEFQKEYCDNCIEKNTVSEFIKSKIIQKSKE